MPHAYNKGATFQFNQADRARRHAPQRERARSTNRAYEAALAELRRHKSKLKAAEELCARKDEMLARECREAAAREAAMQRRHTLNAEAHARRGVLIRMLCNGAVPQHMLDNLSLLVHEQRAQAERELRELEKKISDARRRADALDPPTPPRARARAAAAAAATRLTRPRARSSAASSGPAVYR